MNSLARNTIFRIWPRVIPTVCLLMLVAMVNFHELVWGLPAIEPNLGAPAPELTDLHWVKGQPVSLAANRGTTVTVVEFWATWCPPCRTSIPHLTNLQRRFGPQGLVVVGISDEDTSTVESFVASMGEQMDYAVATCLSPTTKRAYMGRYRVSTIPHAFVVDQQGRIVWIGNPLSGLERALEQLFAGTYDLEAAKRAYTAARTIEVFRALLNAAQPDSEQMRAAEKLAHEIRDALMTSETSSQRSLMLLAGSILTTPKASPSLRELAAQIIDQLKAQNPSDPQIQQLVRFASARDSRSTVTRPSGPRPPSPVSRISKAVSPASHLRKTTTPTLVHGSHGARPSPPPVELK
ncbi:MAG: hypothetical protein KatS3mg130_0213 [Candidatus Sumerlaea sp.]|uniref:Thioredoxin family protein n=1 Tax=Sumerlaea chitinivorans TaxID=2250252 RepID=A0A2Z4Y7T5_SUMC1|nr:thioredoxin family protein [Candidatus Sumerlaea chitinivorans]GIX43805.1 MAG: hypothetical protein KatS3mg130_0213 [Candidatus Sumerlaea sp.]